MKHRFVRYTLDLLDTDIPSRHFVCLQDVSKPSSRHVFRTPLRHVFKTPLRYVFNTHLQDVFNTSSRRLERQKIVTLEEC